MFVLKRETGIRTPTVAGEPRASGCLSTESSVGSVVVQCKYPIVSVGEARGRKRSELC